MTATHRGSFSAGSSSTTPLRPIKDSKRKITRTRTSYSCQACRRRKVKCDKVHPICGVCMQSNEICIYEDGTTSNTTRKDDDDDIAVRKRRRAEIESLSRSDLLAATSSDSDKQSLTLQALESQLALLQSLVTSLRNDTPEPQQTTSSASDTTDPAHKGGSNTAGEVQTPPSSVEDVADEVQEVTAPLAQIDLQQKQREVINKTRSIKLSFWDYISEEVEHLSSVLRTRGSTCSVTTCVTHDDENENDDNHDEDAKSDVSEPPKFTVSAQNCMYHIPFSFHRLADLQNGTANQIPPRKNIYRKSILLQGPQMSDIYDEMLKDELEHVPTQSQSRVLFRSWLTNVHPILPLISPLKVLEYHDAFWTHNQADQVALSPNTPVSQMPLIYAIWYAGSRSISKTGLQLWFPGTTRASLCSKFHDQTVRWLRRNAFPAKFAMQTLVPFLMILAMLEVEEEPMHMSAYMTTAIRAAQSLGLHRITTTSFRHTIDFEYGIRLWWHIVYMDVLFSASNRQPPLIADNAFLTPTPNEVNDAVLLAEVLKDRKHPQAAELQNIFAQSSSSTQPSTHTLIAKARSIATKALRHVIQIQFSMTTVSKPEWEAMVHVMDDAETGINAIINRIPAKGIPELGFVPPPNTIRPPPKELEDDQVSTQAITDIEILVALGTIGDCGRVLGRYYRQKQVVLNNWARIDLSTLSDSVQCMATAPVVRNARSKVWLFARQCCLRYSMSYMRKFLQLGSDPNIETFRWTWPGDYQPLHAASILLVDLYARPDSPEAGRSRAFIDLAFALSASDNGPIIGFYGKTIQRPFHESGIELWELVRWLRDRAWTKAGLDPEYLWTEESQIVVGVSQTLTDEQLVRQSLREDTVGLFDSSPTSLKALHGAIQMVRDESMELQKFHRKDGKSSSVDDSKTVDELTRQRQRHKDLMLNATLVAKRLGLEKMPYPDYQITSGLSRRRTNMTNDPQEPVEPSPNAVANPSWPTTTVSAVGATMQESQTVSSLRGSNGLLQNINNHYQYLNESENTPNRFLINTHSSSQFIPPGVANGSFNNFNGADFDVSIGLSEALKNMNAYPTSLNSGYGMNDALPAYDMSLNNNNYNNTNSHQSIENGADSYTTACCTNQPVSQYANQNQQPIYDTELNRNETSVNNANSYSTSAYMNDQFLPSSVWSSIDGNVTTNNNNNNNDSNNLNMIYDNNNNNSSSNRRNNSSSNHQPTTMASSDQSQDQDQHMEMGTDMGFDWSRWDDVFGVNNQYASLSNLISAGMTKEEYDIMSQQQQH